MVDSAWLNSLWSRIESGVRIIYTSDRASSTGLGSHAAEQGQARRLQILRRSDLGSRCLATSPASSAPTAAANPTSSTRCAGSWASCRRAICAAIRWPMSSSTARARASPSAPPRSNWCSTTATARSAAPTPATTRSRSSASVSRDGTSTYFINGGALPPQGHHAAVPGHGPGLAQLRHHRAGHDLARHRGAQRRHARLRRGGRRHLAYKERRRRPRRASPTRARTWSACRTCATKSTSRSATCSARPTSRAATRN